MTLPLLCILCGFFLLLGYLCSKEFLLAPAVLVSGLWFVCICCYLMVDPTPQTLSSKFCTAMAVWVSCFSLLALAVQSIKIKPFFVDLMPSQPARDIYFYLSLCTLPLLVYDVYLIIQGSTASPFNALRDANVSVEANSKVGRTANFFVVFWLVSYVMELCVWSKKNKWRVVLLAIMNLFYAFISMGKSNFLIFFLATAIVLLYQKRVKMKFFIIGIVLLAGAFVGIQKMRGAYTNYKEFVTLYVASSMKAFDQYVQPNTSEQEGENVFRLYYAVKSKLGYSENVVDPILPFVQVKIDNKKYHTNTYTVLYPFYKDFGLWGVALGAVFLGIVFGVLFMMMGLKSYCALTVYALWSGTLVMQFAGDTFFTILSQNLQYLFFAVIPFIITKYHLFEKKVLQ